MTDPHLPSEHESSSLTCRQILMDLLQRYLDRSTEPGLTAEIDEHMAVCPPCVQFVEEYRATADAVRALRFEDIPAELTERLRQLARREARSTS
jgi:anti-sigma factor RsiW